jgi:hypothetical protein
MAPPLNRAKLKNLLEEYGQIAIYTYLVLWLLTLAGFAIAISTGFKVQSTQGGIGLLGAAWLATKLTQPLRIAASLVLTPAVARVLKKWRGPPHGASDEPAPPAEKPL